MIGVGELTAPLRLDVFSSSVPEPDLRRALFRKDAESSSEIEPERPGVGGRITLRAEEDRRTAAPKRERREGLGGEVGGVADIVG